MKGYFGDDYRGEEEGGPAYDPATLLLARTMAESAGQCWDRLASYPGFHRNRWYQRAQRTLDGLKAANAA